MKILTIQSSVMSDASVTRMLSDRLATRIADGRQASVVQRDTTDLPLLNNQLLTAIRAETRSPEQQDVAAIADHLIREVQEADVIVVGAPMYNFSVPAPLKAWIDLVAHPGKTFNYTANGPVGLVNDKPVYVVVATGGVPIGSAMDFVTPYLRTFFGFIGIKNVQFIAAEGVAKDKEAGIAQAEAAMDKILA